MIYARLATPQVGVTGVDCQESFTGLAAELES